MNDSELKEDEIALTSAGEIVYGDVSGDVVPVMDAASSETGVTPETVDVSEPVESGEQAAVPYTPEELRAVDWGEVDAARLPESVKPYFDVARESFAKLKSREAELEKAVYEARLAASQTQVSQTQAPQLQASQQERYKQLFAATQARAAAALGISPADIDGFNPEHQMALSLSAGEVMNEQNRRESELRDYQGYLTQLQSNEDFEDFNKWGGEFIRNMPQRLQDALHRAAESGDLHKVRQVITELHGRWQKERAAPSPTGAAPSPTGAAPSPTGAAPSPTGAAPGIAAPKGGTPTPYLKGGTPPPVLETASAARDVRQGLDLNVFSRMSPDQQADELTKFFENRK